MSRRTRRTQITVARYVSPDTESEDDSDIDSSFVQLMQAAFAKSRRHSKKNCKCNNKKKAPKKSPEPKRTRAKRTQPTAAPDVINLVGSDSPENYVSESITNNHQKSIQSKVDSFFKSCNLLSDEEDELPIKKSDAAKNSNTVSKEFYVLSDSDEEMPSTSVTKTTTSFSYSTSTVEECKSSKADKDELMEIVDKILESNDTPVETNPEPDNWNEFKSKTDEILGSVNALLGTFKDKPKEQTVDLAVKEKSPTKSKPICPICLEVLEGTIVPGATVCGHIFCLECIRQVVQTSKTCPTCRKRITLKQIHPLYL